jgi:protoheme IX farnesyltransferase
MAIAGNLRATVARDYLALAKPRVILLHLVTAASAMVLAAEGQPQGSTLLFTLVGGGLVAGASNSLNCYFDRDLDRRMARTRDRPLPAGRLRPFQALAFGVITGSIGLLVLSQLVSLLVATLALVALAYYILAYTLWLKRHTYWSAIIGSGAGALPPLIGWVAVTGHVGLTPLLLFAIIVLWTPPHFWALAIFRGDEYWQAGLTVLPAGQATRWITLFSSLLVLASLLLAPAASLGRLYLVVAPLLGLAFLVLAVRLQYRESLRLARHLYFYSILYLIILFAAMVVDCLLK